MLAGDQALLARFQALLSGFETSLSGFETLLSGFVTLLARDRALLAGFRTLLAGNQTLLAGDEPFFASDPARLAGSAPVGWASPTVADANAEWWAVPTLRVSVAAAARVGYKPWHPPPSEEIDLNAKNHLLSCAAVLAIGAGCATNRSGEDGVADRKATLRTLAAERADAASKALAYLQGRMDYGDPLTPEFLERYYEWSRRLRDARIEAADLPAARRDAAQEHADRCSAIARIFERRCEPGDYPIGLVRYEAASAMAEVARQSP